MTADAKDLAPGCFGAASVFSVDSAVCKACVAFEACGVESLNTLQAIRDTINVSDLLAQHAKAKLKAQQKAIPVVKPATEFVTEMKKTAPQPVERKTVVGRVVFDISEEHQAVIGDLSVKTREYAISLSKQNKINECLADLPNGVNTFAKSGPGFLRVACDLLINGGFTKATLKSQLISEFNWTDGTAGSHVAIATALLCHFKIAQAVGQTYTLSPAVRG